MQVIFQNEWKSMRQVVFQREAWWPLLDYHYIDSFFSIHWWMVIPCRSFTTIIRKNVHSSGVDIPSSESSRLHTTGTKNPGSNIAMRLSDRDAMSKSAANWDTFAEETTGYDSNGKYSCQFPGHTGLTHNNEGFACKAERRERIAKGHCQRIRLRVSQCASGKNINAFDQHGQTYLFSTCRQPSLLNCLNLRKCFSSLFIYPLC